MYAKPKQTQIVKDMDLKEQFDYAGARFACYGNMDFEEVFVVDPDTLEYTGKPRLDTEYPMLRSGVNTLSCKFYANAMVSKSVDEQLHEIDPKFVKRDWYDATMLVRVSERAENVVGLATVQREGIGTKREQSADVIPLFGAPS